MFWSKHDSHLADRCRLLPPSLREAVVETRRRGQTDWHRVGRKHCQSSDLSDRRAHIRGRSTRQSYPGRAERLSSGAMISSTLLGAVVCIYADCSRATKTSRKLTRTVCSVDFSTVRSESSRVMKTGRWDWRSLRCVVNRAAPSRLSGHGPDGSVLETPGEGMSSMRAEVPESIVGRDSGRSVYAGHDCRSRLRRHEHEQRLFHEDGSWQGASGSDWQAIRRRVLDRFPVYCQ